ncbi:hypothetical protein FA132_22020 [Pseudomonas aeruginosa]|nr:hypothetical protein [Pseudomonas aeruginosa]
MSFELARALVATLPKGSHTLFNPYTDRCVFDSEINGPEQRLERLAMHLDCDAKVVLIGEAPGYAGCRFSGVAFTSERQLLSGSVPRIKAPEGRLTTPRLSFTENSATTVWGNLYKLHQQDHAVMWNALQMHPSKDGSVLSNRTPTPAELAHGRAALSLIREAFPKAMLISIGQKAKQLLRDAGLQADWQVRHPANGGVPEFEAGLAEAFRQSR